MGRNILAGVVGVVVAGLLVWLVETAGHAVYPPPEGLNFADADAMREYIDGLPAGALLFVIAAWFIGTVGGTCAACAIGTMLPRVFAIFIGCLMLVATAMNVIMIPHPNWFIVLAVIAIAVGAWLGTMCKRSAPGDAA
ncbi:MAG: hypothetical protein OEY37_01165 [Gammaproteobacteria bacterium]|nr:hypothetical protein [Gammaproteobacteria bacterium]MDH5619973.1 hypothetical protein [Gammaproteobacteria bacterium]